MYWQVIFKMLICFVHLLVRITYLEVYFYKFVLFRFTTEWSRFQRVIFTFELVLKHSNHGLRTSNEGIRNLKRLGKMWQTNMLQPSLKIWAWGVIFGCVMMIRRNSNQTFRKKIITLLPVNRIWTHCCFAVFWIAHIYLHSEIAITSQ